MKTKMRNGAGSHLAQATDGVSPDPRCRNLFIGSPRPAGPQPRDGLRLALP